MIFSLLMILLVAAIAYFHYAQGFFSAFLSLVLAAIAAVVAFGFHEQIAIALLGGQFSDQAHGMVLCGLYAVTYLVLRVAFDKMVPGYVNFGVWPDRIGGLGCGVFAGILTAGVVAVGAQSLPFGPSIGGYSRFESLGDSKVTYGSTPDWTKVGRDDFVEQLYKRDELKNGSLEESDTNPRRGLFVLPVDDMVVSFFGKVSEGALAGDTKWRDIHPSYVDELFAQRLGLQPRVWRTAFPGKGQSQLTVVGLFYGPKGGYDQIDGDVKEFRPAGSEEVPPKLTAPEGKTLVIARVKFGEFAADKDRKVRFSTSSLRLVAGGKNYYPVATMVGTGEAAAQRADDFLVVDAGQGADFVFVVDTAALLGDGVTPDAAEAKVKAGTFLEFKRLSRSFVGGQELKKDDDRSEDPVFEDSILRRKGWGEKK